MRQGNGFVPARSSELYKKRKRNVLKKFEVLCFNKAPEVLIDPYVMNESKLKEAVLLSGVQ